MRGCLFIAAARVVRAPSITEPAWKALFATEEAWRAWCRQDELDEAEEMIWSEIGRP